MPVAEKKTVDRIEAFGSPVKKATPGDSVGIFLHDTQQLKRGYVLTDTEEKLKPAKAFVAQLIVFADVKLSVGDKVSLRIGTAEANCEVNTILEKIDPVKLTVEERKSKSMKNGEVGKVLFRPLEPLYLEEYSEFPQLGRFVIIGKKGAAAAGIVLEKKLRSATPE
jgi:sulfate adenylyltransferase subunit 1 (EFTu-like GTPase family)